MGEVITGAERALTDQLREATRDVISNDEFLTSDAFLLRFVRDRDLKLKDAETAFRRCVAWRETNKINNILREPVNPVVAKSVNIYFGPHCKEGRPIGLLPIGSWPFKMILDNGLIDDMLRQMFRIFETGQQVLEKEQKPGELLLATVIVDLKHLSYRDVISKDILQMIISFVSEARANWPEIFRVVYVINAPMGFSFIYNKVVKAIIPKRYTSRIFVYGKNEAEWTKALEQAIDKDQLFTSYGGDFEAIPIKYNISGDNVDESVDDTINCEGQLLTA